MLPTADYNSSQRSRCLSTRKTSIVWFKLLK